ncbi:MAG: hypothetical protein ACW99Q_25545 [Candidatus Kariarchaeaceae archaeon]|jgi:hypothetical protein
MSLSDMDIKYVKALDPDKVYVIGIDHKHLTQTQYAMMGQDIVDVFKQFNISVVIVSSHDVDFIEPKGD